MRIDEYHRRNVPSQHYVQRFRYDRPTVEYIEKSVINQLKISDTESNSCVENIFGIKICRSMIQTSMANGNRNAVARIDLIASTSTKQMS